MIWITAILLVFALVEAVIIGLALAARDRHKRAYAIASKNAMEYVQERNALKAQIEQYGRDAIDQANRVDAALRERDEAIHMFNGLQTRFDAIRAEIEALKHPVKPRTSRAKPHVGKEEV